jgi:hypothetical protein
VLSGGVVPVRVYLDADFHVAALVEVDVRGAVLVVVQLHHVRGQAVCGGRVADLRGPGCPGALFGCHFWLSLRLFCKM